MNSLCYNYGKYNPDSLTLFQSSNVAETTFVGFHKHWLRSDPQGEKQCYSWNSGCGEYSTLCLIMLKMKVLLRFLPSPKINNVGEWGWGVEGKQVGSMDEESQVRGCYNITFICTPTNQETV